MRHHLTIRSQKLRGRKSADLRLEPNNLIQNPRPPCAQNGRRNKYHYHGVAACGIRVAACGIRVAACGITSQ